MSQRRVAVLTVEKEGRTVRLIEVEARSYTVEVDGRPRHSGEEDLGRALRIVRRLSEGEADPPMNESTGPDRRPAGMPRGKR